MKTYSLNTQAMIPALEILLANYLNYKLVQLSKRIFFKECQNSLQYKLHLQHVCSPDLGLFPEVFSTPVFA